MIQGDILDNSFHPRLQLGHILYLIKGGKYDDERIVQQIIGSLFILHIMEAYSIKLSGVLSVNVLKDMLVYSAHIIYRHKNNKRLRRKSYKSELVKNPVRKNLGKARESARQVFNDLRCSLTVMDIGFVNCY